VGESAIVVEQSSTEQFARLMSERGGVKVEQVITRYDGRPFEPTELAEEIRRAIG
jgi:2-oxoglutarate ferredoxin oxidoreductase subunit alpha